LKLDEIWVNQNHTRFYVWQNNKETEELKIPTGKGGRIVNLLKGQNEFLKVGL